ncbi:MAG TPA: PIG-L family deacetylase [Bryobacteraceae bacterium]|jgi:LmbE family N-acetylglucosaminyl deacetylase|nr:PIG-L family deacetylase [Bryobacteraceae bacterium]
MRIVSVHAHPDDAEILAGGNLALLSRLKREILIVTLQRRRLRLGDARTGRDCLDSKSRGDRSAALIGAGYRWCGFRDLAIFSDDPSRRIVTGLLRELRPDIVLTAAPIDYLCDHEATSQLVRDACFAASIPNYKTPAQSPAKSSGCNSSRE